MYGKLSTKRRMPDQIKVQMGMLVGSTYPWFAMTETIERIDRAETGDSLRFLYPSKVCNIDPVGNVLAGQMAGCFLVVLSRLVERETVRKDDGGMCVLCVDGACCRKQQYLAVGGF